MKPPSSTFELLICFDQRSPPQSIFLAGAPLIETFKTIFKLRQKKIEKY
jgi:hypothetical protein